jgi:PilZ domain
MQSDRRTEPRIAVAVPAYLVSGTGDRAAERVVTENVSSGGARIVCRQRLHFGERPAISSISLGFQLSARVVYCQPRSDRTFDVGLQFERREESWWASHAKTESTSFNPR